MKEARYKRPHSMIPFISNVRADRQTYRDNGGSWLVGNERGEWRVIQ